MNIQAIKFKPIYKETLWGGSKIPEFKEHLLPTPAGNDLPATHIGESWEISGVEGSESVVCEGPYEALPLPELGALLRGTLLRQDRDVVRHGVRTRCHALQRP